MNAARKNEISTRVESVRRFNRFYTRQIGLLHEGLLESALSLTEVRVLYELAHRQMPTASEIAQDLGLDAGYLSRLLRGFQRRGWISRQSSRTDARQSLLSLTPGGKATFVPLDRRARKDVEGMLAKLSEAEQRRLTDAMQTVEKLLREREQPRIPYILRAHEPGDMGWVVHRHGALYAEEYGYSEEFEALVAEIVAHFLRHLDAKRERCWIAERESEIVGSVFLVKKTKRVAQLRLLLVEPSARGLGIGRRLVSETIRFARQAGYRRIILWTQSELLAARHLYKEAGFQITDRKKHHTIKKNLIAETWELKL
jgi:DNA-binding MarR family transcriptional regulator/N-acetylglutamate synthase-like GNAT family acetyltransferase